MTVAAGAATGGQTGIAAVTGRRKQLKSQQLQPVAAAANIATADRTNSFFMFGLLGTTDRGESGGSEWLDYAAGGQASARQIANRTVRRSGGGLCNSTPPSLLCKRHALIFVNKSFADAPLAAPETRGARSITFGEYSGAPVEQASAADHN
jgi:hypothetical protein